jgi:hypothetical protein
MVTQVNEGQWLRRWAAVLSLSACSSHVSAPPLANCSGEGCHQTGYGIGSGYVGTGGSTSTTDAGSSFSATVSAVTFAPVATDVLAWSLSNVKAFSDAVEVKVLSSTGTVLTSSGSGSFTFDAVSNSDGSWATARPTATSLYLPGMISLAQVTGAVNVPLMLTDDFAFLASLVHTPTVTLDTKNYAQVVIKVVDSQGNGVRNARVADIGAAATAYASAGAWVDSSTGPYTDLSGRVVMVNLAAAAAPGTFATITASGTNSLGNAVSTTALVPIEVGFVSYAAVVLSLS